MVYNTAPLAPPPTKVNRKKVTHPKVTVNHHWFVSYLQEALYTSMSRCYFHVQLL
jgi:hypothetical protein